MSSGHPVDTGADSDPLLASSEIQASFASNFLLLGEKLARPERFERPTLRFVV
jgi:hypothetical protein